MPDGFISWAKTSINVSYLQILVLAFISANKWKRKGKQKREKRPSTMLGLMLQSLQLPCWQHHRCNDIDWFSFKLLFSNQNPEKACVCWASSVMQTNRLNVVNCPVIMSVFQNYYFSLTVIVVYLEYHQSGRECLHCYFFFCQYKIC